MDLFSGGRAISENLQLNRELRLSTDEQNRTIPVSSVTGITIDEIPWKDWMKDEKPKLDSVASILPHDQHAIIFSSYSSMLELMDEATARGTPLLRLSEDRAESARSKENTPSSSACQLTSYRILGPKLISSVAITGSDPFLRTGTSLALIFEAKQKRRSSGGSCIAQDASKGKISSSQNSIRGNCKIWKSQVHRDRVS